MALLGNECGFSPNEVYGGCADATGCDDLPTCATNPDTGAEVLFPDSCTPAGWAACTQNICP